jgi:glycosyltransferase involved in cell wall biosynthesis
LSNYKATGFKVVYFFVYRAWLNKVHHLIRNETENKDVKFIHLLNHISFREPGRFSELSIPFLWGPISGCSAIAPGFIASAPLRIKIQNRLRDFSNYIALRKKSVKLACSNASTIFVVTREDARLLPIYNLPVKILSDVGCKLSQTTSIRQRLSSDHDELRILWVGRLDYNKALHILLHSLQQVTTSSQRRVKLSVIGSGTEKAYLQGVSQSLSSFIRIDWFGEIPHDQVLAEMQTHHIFVHTSIKEAGCTVVMEALSSGLPVACHDAFGMASTVDESCGWKIPYKDPILSGNAFAAIIDEILDNPSLIELKSRMALLKRRSISWESIVNRITLAYKEQEARDLRG